MSGKLYRAFWGQQHFPPGLCLLIDPDWTERTASDRGKLQVLLFSFSVDLSGCRSYRGKPRGTGVERRGLQISCVSWYGIDITTLPTFLQTTGTDKGKKRRKSQPPTEGLDRCASHILYVATRSLNCCPDQSTTVSNGEVSREPGNTEATDLK